MSYCEINDKRNPAEFKGITFSKFQKSKVKKELLTCLTSSKIESACYWSAELICAGHYSELWEIIILFFTKYIHLGNPKLPIYIAMRIDNFKVIISNGYIGNELRMRNNIKIRKLFTEIITILCISRKKHAFEPVKIKKTDEFNMAFMASKLKAPNINYASGFIKPGDAKELYIAYNEFAYHISTQSKNVVSATYWLEWILDFESLCKKQKDNCNCERRTFAPVLDKYQFDCIWIIWEIIIEEGKKLNNPIINKIIESLLTIFSIKYTNGVKKRRRFIIYNAIALLTEMSNINIEIVNDTDVVANILKKYDLVYQDVKKNEVSPNTDYLNHNVGKSNLDKTVERLEKMNKLSGL
jgi:hypothetical protein